MIRGEVSTLINGQSIVTPTGNMFPRTKQRLLGQHYVWVYTESDWTIMSSETKQSPTIKDAKHRNYRYYDIPTPDHRKAMHTVGTRMEGNAAYRSGASRKSKLRVTACFRWRPAPAC